MENPITIREAVTENDVATFWEQLHIYYKQDIFPDPNDEGREYFLSDTEYRAHMQKIHDRLQTWCKENNISSLTVCCAPCDEKIYQALGFDIGLGTTFAHIE